MKPNQIPSAVISPITRVVMVHNGNICLMVKVPSGITDPVANDRIKYADYIAQLAVKNKRSTYDAAFVLALSELEMGFDVMNMTDMLA